VAEATARHDGRELMEALQAEGVAAGLVLDCADVITDRQLVHQRQWATLDHPEMGPSLYSTVPLSFSATPARPYRPAPLLGQHTAEVCKEWLGLDDGEIQALAAEDVLK
jgi:benzylsuccinate CoA-transferase BbsF subunit